MKFELFTDTINKLHSFQICCEPHSLLVLYKFKKNTCFGTDV